MKIVPRFRADFQPVDVVVEMRVSLTARTRQRGAAVGMLTFALDVALQGLGTPGGCGYDLTP